MASEKLVDGQKIHCYNLKEKGHSKKVSIEERERE